MIWRLHTDAPTSIVMLLKFRKQLFVFLLLLTILFAFVAYDLQIDSALNLTHNPKSSSYSDYKNFVHTFGTDQTVLLALRLPSKITDISFLDRLGEVTTKLGEIDGVYEVMSIMNVRLPQMKGGVFGVYPLITKAGPHYRTNINEIRRARVTWPMLNMLVSRDLRTLGF